jgi:hypothetical protein
LDHKYTLFNIDYDAVFEEAAAGQLAGAEALLMSQEDLHLSLCVHLAKHCYFASALLDRPDFTERVLDTGLLIQYCDIAEVTRHYSAELDWELALQKARIWQVEPAVQPVLASAVRLFRTRVPATLLQGLAVPEMSRLRRQVLASAVRNDRDKEAGAISPMSPVGRLPGLNASLMFRPVRLLDALDYLWPSHHFIAARYGSRNPVTVGLSRGLHVGRTVLGLVSDLARLAYYSGMRRYR